eukprot:CAMPEP_0113469432 /NCGR_PEP_ID=MMETSP0014_2-20120614/15898_1 /TAXON_ID=2857 /ORGANISM="Nitzschia sp." /LENGTH=468 /DNA_ID=CAMNT_0000361913 /DNA_START=137 /DNA_END=1543 /DNA_ORIENTATION=+ /assembly_acc=CAM_ASM_000159
MMQWALGGLNAADTEDEGGAAAHRRMLQDTSNLRGTTTDDVSEVDMEFVPTVTRERFDDLQRLQAQQEQRDKERQQNPPESIVDPPGFRSKWKQSTLEYFNAEIAYNKNRTNDIRVNRHRLKPDCNNNNSSNNGTKIGDGVVDDNVSSSSTRSTSTLGRSWVPVTSQRKDFPSADARRRQEARAWERQRATAGIYSNPYLGWETRTALTTSVPTKTWTPYLGEEEEDDANKKKRRNDATKPASVSWAPHVDPNNPEALTPYPPQNAVAGSKRRGGGDDYDGDEESIEEEIVYDDDNSGRSSSSGRRSGSGSTSSSESYEIEIVDDSEYTDDDSRQQKKPNSFVPPQVRRTLSSHSSQESSSDDDDSNSDNTDAYFARDAAAGRTNGASGRGKASSSSASSASQSTSSSSDVESGCLGMFSPIEMSDNFQVFDDDCVFSPTRGTMCVMCLCIVCTAVWVVVLLYFFVIR